ncbi:MAG: EthD family reductase [Chloroflexi bacterium]|nr:EthD family reductase [Chloroflexota bacterium]
MHKLSILFESPENEQAFQLGWQKFLGLAEKMPGLRRETVSRVERVLFGKSEGELVLIHELLFDSKEALDAAMQSPEGQAAGTFLQSFTGGRVVLLLAEHMEAGAGDFRKNTLVTSPGASDAAANPGEPATTE